MIHKTSSLPPIVKVESVTTLHVLHYMLEATVLLDTRFRRKKPNIKEETGVEKWECELNTNLRFM